MSIISLITMGMICALVIFFVIILAFRSPVNQKSISCIVTKNLMFSGAEATLHVRENGEYYMTIIMEGPDRRYNAAQTTYSRPDIGRFILTLTRAVEMIDSFKELGSKAAAERFELAVDHEVGVSIQAGIGLVTISARSHTYTFYRSYSRRQALAIIDTLNGLPALVAQMTQEYSELKSEATLDKE